MEVLEINYSILSTEEYKQLLEIKSKYSSFREYVLAKAKNCEKNPDKLKDDPNAAVIKLSPSL